MFGRNETRLAKYLLKSEHTPDGVKETVARKCRFAEAVEYAKQLDSKKRAGDSMVAQLKETRKAARASGSAEEKHDERSQLITKYMAQEAAMPKELLRLIMASLAVFIFMCRLPFSLVMNVHFIRFLWSIRPNFAKKIT